MKKLRILSLFLAVVMVLFLFAGCGKEAETVTQSNTPAASGETSETPAAENPSEPITLKVWESDGPEKEFMEEMAAQYMKENPNVTIVVEPVANTDAAQRMQLDGPAGVGADVFVAPHDKLGEMISSGIILENAYAEEVKKVMVDAAITATSYDGKLYGYPIGVETYALFYNKDLVSDPPETWEEIEEFCKKFNDKSQGKYGIVWDVDDAYYGYMFLSSYGADLFGPDGTDKSKHMINSEEAIKGMEYFQKFRKEYLDVDAADLTGDFMNAGFQNGTIAMVITGPWSIEGYKEAGVNFGVTTLPKLPGSDQVPHSFSGIRALYVSAYSKYPEEAQKFAYYCITKEALTKRYEITSQIPPRNDIQITDEANNGILAQFVYSKPMPSIPAMNTYWSVMGSAYANIWNGSDIRTELDLAASAVESTE